MTAQDLTIQRWEEAAAIARPLTLPEREALRADIAARGVVYPVMVLPDGRIVDGHHRWELSDGQAPIKVLPPMSDPEALFLAGQLNHARRHLDQAEWKALLTRQEQRRLGVSMLSVMTLAEVAKAFGVGTSTVFGWKKAAGITTFAESANVSAPAAITDDDAFTAAPPARSYNRVKDHREALTDLERKKMTRLYWNGVPPKDLATQFNVDVRTVRRIANASERTRTQKAPSVTAAEPTKDGPEDVTPTKRVTRTRRVYSLNDPLTAPIGASQSQWTTTILGIIEFTKALRDQGVRPLVRQWSPTKLAQTLTDLDQMIGQIQQLRAEVAAAVLPAEDDDT